MPPSTLEIVTAARDRIRDEPDSYEFMDYCHCLAGHVHLAATGKEFDYDRDSPYRRVDSKSPVGQVIDAMLTANGVSFHPLTLSALSHLNSRLSVEVPDIADGYPDPAYRQAAVLALNNTIAHLEESS